MKFYNLRRIFRYIQYLRRQRAEGVSIFTSLKRMAIFFILYLIITGITALIIIFTLNSNIKIVTVPKVVNMDFARAYQELHNLGLNVDIELKHFENIPKGIVAYQSIEPLKKVKEKRTIQLIISLGPESETALIKKPLAKVRSYVINFKLPDKYETAKVKIIIDDAKSKNRVVFDDVIAQTNIIRVPLKIYGTATQKIFINDSLFLEKEIE